MLPQPSGFHLYNILLNLIFRKYLPEIDCVVQVGLHLAHFTNVSSYIIPDYWDTFSDTPCNTFLIDGPDAFEYIEKHVIRRNTFSRYNNRKYIIVTEKLFSSKLFKHVENVVLLKRVRVYEAVYHYHQSGDEDSNVNKRYLTDEYYEIHAKDFVTNHFYLVDVWNATTKAFIHGQLNGLQNVLFPNRLRNLSGLTINIGTILYIPYSDFDSKVGIELNCVIEFARKLGASINVVEVGERYSGEGLPRRSRVEVSDILDGLADGSYDIGCSGLFTLFPRYESLDLSMPTSLAKITCLVPAPKQINGVKYPTAFVSYPNWILLLGWHACLVILNMLKNSCGMKRQIEKVHTFELIAILSLQTLSLKKVRMFESLSSRIFIFCILLNSYFTGVMYNSWLKSDLVVPPKLDYINTIEDLANSNLTWIESNDAFSLPLERDAKMLSRKIVHKFDIRSPSDLKEVAKTAKFAFAIKRFASGYYAIGNYITSDIIELYSVMRKNLFEIYSSMYLRQNSVYLNKLNDFILRCDSAGLMRYWEREAAILNSHNKIQNYLSEIVTDVFIDPLEIYDLYHAFLLLLFGIVISSLTFLLEIYIDKYHK